LFKYFIGKEGAERFKQNPVGVPLIIDVFRCSSTIITALVRGAIAIFPMEGVEESRKKALKTGALLAGERGGIPPKGFDFGNSPCEMLRADIKGKEIVLTTGMGTKLMVEGGVVTSTLNISRVVDYVNGKDVSFIIGGRDEYYVSPDDFALAKIVERKSNGQSHSDWVEVLEKNCQNTERLRKIGFGDDVDFILNSFDRFPVIPVITNGKITLLDKGVSKLAS
jgi:2-phosphosulfolactate phosphatase